MEKLFKQFLICNILILNSCPTESGRLCYGCLPEVPSFNYDNSITENRNTPCYYHTNLTCTFPMSKCFIEVRMTDQKTMVSVEKGCADATETSGCITQENIETQRCVCERKLCNADILVAGGSKVYAEAIFRARENQTSIANSRNQQNDKSVLTLTLVIVLLFQLLVFDRFSLSNSLTCCSGTTELTETTISDGDDRTSPCTNEGTSCQDVGCKKNECGSEFCPSNITCPSPDDVCKLVYYDRTSVIDDESSSNEVSLSLKQFVSQECFDTKSEEDPVPLQCEFFNKIFYLDKYTRVSIHKECYCNEDMCNQNIQYACKSTVDSITTVNDTCKSGSPPVVIIMVKDAYFKNLLVVITIFFVSSQQ